MSLDGATAVWPAIGFFWLTVQVMTAGWPPNWGVLQFALIMLFFIWSNIWGKIADVFTIEDSALHRTWRQTLRLGLPIICAVFVLGYYNAASDLKRFSDPYILRLKSTEQKQLKIMLRNFEKGLLLRDTLTNRVEFLRWEDVAAIEKPIATKIKIDGLLAI